MRYTFYNLHGVRNCKYILQTVTNQARPLQESPTSGTLLSRDISTLTLCPLFSKAIYLKCDTGEVDLFCSCSDPVIHCILLYVDSFIVL